MNKNKKRTTETKQRYARAEELEELGRQRKAVIDSTDGFLIRQRIEREQAESEAQGVIFAF